LTALAEKVIAISKPYFGPATESFLSRQCKGHLKVDVGELTPAHLPELAKWVATSAALIMDQAKATEVANKISKL
jgi:hypothetical protein